jgi:hypothetical protein
MSSGMKSTQRACCGTEAPVAVMAIQTHRLFPASFIDPMDGGR